jgi:hypothetical protein
VWISRPQVSALDRACELALHLNADMLAAQHLALVGF